MKSLYIYIDIDTSAFSLSMECFGHHLGVQGGCRVVRSLPLVLWSRRGVKDMFHEVVAYLRFLVSMLLLQKVMHVQSV
jgi:hypothetical protein